jgi:arabinose-5-phosphate isomerase
MSLQYPHAPVAVLAPHDTASARRRIRASVARRQRDDKRGKSVIPTAMTQPDDIAIGRRVLATEIAALSSLSEGLGAAFVQAVETILKARGRVICTGIGKSGHVARKIAATFASTGTQAHYVHATEASHGDLGMISQEDVVLALSKSGETSELSDVIHYSRRFAIPLVAVTARKESALGSAADVCLQIPDAPEACAETNAPTTSTTLMIALGDALAVALLERRGFKADHFRVYHPGGRLGAMLRTASDLMHVGGELPLVSSGTSLKEGIAAISEKGFGIVGVVGADGRLAGIVTDGDLRRHLASGERADTVDQVMTRSPQVAAPHDLAALLLRLMNEREVGGRRRPITQLFVVQDGRPVGLIHLHDLLRAGVV